MICDGYDMFDLEVLVDRAIHAAASRNLLRRTENSISTQVSSKPLLLNEDFRNAIENFTPTAMRGISNYGSPGGCMEWEDVGSLFDTWIAVKEMLELPVKYSKIFSKAPLQLRSGVLLYDPPGYGKTHILPIASDVDLGIRASNTEGFSNADLQVLLSDAQLESVHQHINRDTPATSEHPVTTNKILESVSTNARLSVSEKEIEMLYAIYGEFQNSRAAVSAKKKDSKGKISTLA